MKRFTDAGRKAVADQNFYAALSLALMMPDICASIEDPGPGKSRNCYVRWCKKWVEPKFSRSLPVVGEMLFLSAEDCYQLRCSLIHSGTADVEESKRDTLHTCEFFDDTAASHLNRVSETIIGGVKQPNWLQLKASKFSETMFEAADEWDASVASDAVIQAEKEKLLIIHSRGVILHGVKIG